MAAQDRYDEYFSEKLWAMIPEVYRAEDGAGTPPGVLRAIVDVISEQAAVSRRSIDRLWEDQHIETCDDWAVPYIGDLLGARLLPESDPRARRADVARTVHFRRRRGTPSLLAEIVDDLSGWDVVLVEAFRRLARSAHRLDAFPAARGRVTRTPVAGTAQLRNPRGSDLAGSAFDEFFRTADVRLLRGKSGRIGLGNVNLHLFRLFPLEIIAADPGKLADTTSLDTFTFDPSGRDTALFTPGVQFEAVDRPCLPSQEWEIAQAISCRLISDAAYLISSADLGALPQVGAGAPTADERGAIAIIVGLRFSSEARLRRRLSDLGVNFTGATPSWYQDLLERAVTRDSARQQLFPDCVSVTLFPAAPGTPLELNSAQQILGADLSSRACQPAPANPLTRLLIDPKLGRFAFTSHASNPTDPAPLVHYHYGSSGDVGAGTYERTPISAANALTPRTGGGALGLGDSSVIQDNRTYLVDASSPISVTNLVLRAEAEKRPYVELTAAPTGSAATFRQAAGTTPAKLLLDGIWLGSSARFAEAAGPQVLDLLIERDPSNASDVTHWDEVRINCSTLDPGGKRADGQHLAAIRIQVRSHVKLLRISRSIVGPIEVDPVTGSVETIEIVDSIVDATRVPGTVPGVAILNGAGHVRLAGTTVLGEIRAERLLASDCIVMGPAGASAIVVADTQHSCFRFSAAPPSTERMPDSYRSVFREILPFHFTSLRFGDPGYAELSTLAPEELRSGAENGSEMGAFSGGTRTAHLASIQAKVEEFKPVAILTQFIIEGETATGALP
jgi:hypothetical protein